MRLLITGMGGELGTRLARLAETLPDVTHVLGVDLDPPRQRLTRTEFHRIDPRNRERTRVVIRDLAPTAVVHLGVYEPYARSSPRAAVARTASGTIAAVMAAAATGQLDRIVVRSGIEVYGRRRGEPLHPDEAVRPRPSSPFGHSLLHVERVCAEAGRRAGAPVTLLRFAPLAGPHFPSPLGRLLRLPLVPCSPSDPPFSVLHQDDAARAIIAGLRRPVDQPVNVVAGGAVTVTQAARRGRRVPVPVAGPAWRGAALACEVAGAPIPAHVHELLVRGRTADGSAVTDVIGWSPARTTSEVVDELYRWDDPAERAAVEAVA